MNGSLSFGLKKNNWNFLFSSTGRNTYSLNYINRQDYQSSTELAYQYKDTLFTKTSLLNGLANITYIGNNKYSLKTLFNHQIEQSYLTRNGENYDNVQDVRSNSSNNTIKTTINTQFDGKIKTLDFNLGYNLMLRQQPDYRVNPITKSLSVNEAYQTAWRDTYRFWSIMDENSFNGSINKDLGNFKKLFGSKFKNYLGSTYDIFQNKSIIPFLGFKPTEEVVQKTKEMFKQAALQNGRPITDLEAEGLVSEILKQSKKINPKLGLPAFKYENYAMVS